MDSGLSQKIQNTQLQDALVTSIKSIFPLENQGKRMIMSNLRFDDTLDDMNFPQQKEVKLERKSWQNPIIADFSIIDAETGRQISAAKNVKIGNIPKITNRFTTIIDGNEYQTVNQIRRKSGIYSRIKRNGELESEFNLSKGQNFKMQLDIDNQHFVIMFENRKYRLWTLLNTIGVQDSEMRKAWGDELLELNKKGALNTEVSEMTSIYKKLYNKDPKDYKEVISGLQKYFNEGTEVDPDTTKLTLGESFSKADGPAMLAASKKLLAINRGEGLADERDSLVYKRVFSTDDLLVSYFDKLTPQLKKKLERTLGLKDQVREVISAATFGEPIKRFFTVGDLSTTPPQTNPVTIAAEWRKTTPMGTGGIQSSHAITTDARDIQPTHLGFLDPLSTPECSRPDTQVFTLNGWKRFDEVVPDDLIACNINGTLEFHKPEQVKTFDYKGFMYGFKNKKIDLLVTQNHRVWGRPLDRRSNLGYRIETASEVYGKDRLMQMGHIAYENKNAEQTYKNLNMTDWAAFMGWFISEGTRAGLYKSCVQISQSSKASKNNVAEIKNLLNKLGFKWKYSCNHNFNIKESWLVEELKPLGYCDEKYIPEYLFNTGLEAREALLDSLLKGDGRKSFYKATGAFQYNKVYTTTSKQLSIDVQRLAISLGFATSINVYPDNREERYLDVYEIRMFHKSETQVLASKGHQYKEWYEGPVVGITVPGGLIYVKTENSSPVWTGNSLKVGITVGLSSEVRKQGNDLITPVFDLTGKIHWFTPIQFFDNIIGFPDQYVRDEAKNVVPRYDSIKSMYKGESKEFPKAEVKYFLRSPRSMFSYQANLVPFMHSTQGNRAATGARMITQALAIDEKEAPLVQTYRDKNSTYEHVMGAYLNQRAGVNGIVTKVNDDYVEIKTDEGKTKKVGLYNNFPLNQDGYLQSNVLVKTGDSVVPESFIADNNYSDNQTLALGKNLDVAYMSYKGYNFEDGAVMTESAAQRMAHTMLHRINVYYSPKLTVFDKRKFNAWFPDLMSQDNFNKLDDKGIIKVGETVQPDEIVCALLIEKEMDDIEQTLKKLDKYTFNNYSKNVTRWDEEDPGVVTDVRVVGRNVDIYVKAKHPLKEGDKIAGRYGNKCWTKRAQLLSKDRGIIPISDVTVNDEIATLRPGTQELEWQRPVAVVAEPINVPYIYKVTGAQLEIETTSTHKQYVKTRNCKRNGPDWNDYELLEAKDIFGKRVKHKRNADWEGESFKYINVGPYSIEAENFFAFLGYFLSEGWTSTHRNQCVVAVCQSEKNVNELNEIRTLYKLCFPNVNITEHYSAKTKMVTIKVHNKEIHEYFGKFKKSNDKYIPTKFKNANKGLLALLFRSLIKGDGSEEANRTRYFTISKRLAEDVFEIGLKLGYTPNITTREQKLCKINGVQIKTAQILYIVSLNKTQGAEPVVNGDTKVIEEWIPYNDKVYCVEVPNHIIYVILNGKGVWSGNSIITKLIPDADAPHRANGKPIDILLSPEGVPGRMNIGQLLETAAGKIAEKQGKTYVVNNFQQPEIDSARQVYDDLKANGLEANEKLIDGKTGVPIETPIFVGKQYIMKLRHIVKKKQGVHSFGSYDTDEQPTGKGVQKIGILDAYSYLSHGAKTNLREMAEIKGRKNDEYWRDLQFGLPPGKPNRNFVFEKMIAYLKGSGINVEKKGNNLRIFPLTDADVTKMSAGELTDPGAMLIGKNLTTRKGGLFDPTITGGVKGTNWSHLTLVERIPNPMYEDAIMKALDLTEADFGNVLHGKKELNSKTGVTAIINGLNNIDVNARIKTLKADLKTAPPTNVNKLNTKLKYMLALKDLDMKAADAYTMSKVPVVPPQFRTIYPLPSGDLMVSDINKHYRDVGLINQSLKGMYSELSNKDKVESQVALYNSVKALQGFTDPMTFSKDKYKGFIKELGQMKSGLIQGVLWTKPQDLSGRSTITVEPDLGLDQVGVPVDMAYTMYKPFIMREMKQSGIKVTDAKKYYDEESPIAKNALNEVIKTRPIILNRAPSLHKHSVQAFNPVLMKGKSIRLNPLIIKGFNADFDGDTMSMMVPISSEAVEEAKHMMPSKILFKHGDNQLMPNLTKDYIFGLWELSKTTSKSGKSFKSIDEAKQSGLKWTEEFKLNGKPMTIGQYMINSDLPDKYKDYTRVLNSKTAEKLLTSIGKESPHHFPDVINTWKNLGATYSYLKGHTISITDFIGDKGYRDTLLKAELPAINKLKGEKRIEALNALTLKVQDAQNLILSKSDNNLGKMSESGSFNKKDSIRQILSMPGVLTDINGAPLEIPVLKSYGEGLDTASYWNSLYAVRKGTVDRAVNTQESGALNKSLLNVNRRLLVIEIDCGTDEGLEFEINDKNVMDRALLHSVAGVGKRNNIVDNIVIQKAKQKGLVTLKVRSPLTCHSIEGVCQMCYGLLPNGQLAPVGENVGVSESQAVTERSTQLTMKSFHSGGSALAGGGIAAGFPRIEQLLKVPEKLGGKATLAEEDGLVGEITKSVTGGYFVKVNTKNYVIAPGRIPVVTSGQRVQQGDPLSDGVVKPQELGELTTHLAAQQHIVKELGKVYEGQFYDKTFETVLRGISDNAEITSAPDDSGAYRGDKTSISYIDSVNRKRKKDGLELITYKPYFKSIDTLNTDSDDWMTRITTNRVKAGLTIGASKGQYSNIKGKDPIPSYLYGDGFGKNTDYSGGEFY